MVVVYNDYDDIPRCWNFLLGTKVKMGFGSACMT